MINTQQTLVLGKFDLQTESRLPRTKGLFAVGAAVSLLTSVALLSTNDYNFNTTVEFNFNSFR